jgi:hypothetical protein
MNLYRTVAQDFFASVSFKDLLSCLCVHKFKLCTKVIHLEVSLAFIGKKVLRLFWLLLAFVLYVFHASLFTFALKFTSPVFVSKETGEEVTKKTLQQFYNKKIYQAKKAGDMSRLKQLTTYCRQTGRGAGVDQLYGRHCPLHFKKYNFPKVWHFSPTTPTPLFVF